MPKRKLTTALGMVACLTLAGACASNDEMLQYHPAIDGSRMGDDIRTPQDESRDHDDSDAAIDRRAVSMSNADSSSAVVTNLNLSDATPAATLTIGTAPARTSSHFYSDNVRYVGSVSAADAQENSLPSGNTSPSVSAGITPTIVASDRQVSSTVNANAVPGVVSNVPTATGSGMHANRLVPPQQATGRSSNVSVSDVAVTPTVAAGSSPVTSTVNATVPTAAVDPTTTAAVGGETVPNATVAAPAVEVVDTDRAMNPPATTTSGTATKTTPSAVAATSSRLATTAAAEGAVSTTSGDGGSRVRIENGAATGKTTKTSTTRRTTTTKRRK